MRAETAMARRAPEAEAGAAAALEHPWLTPVAPGSWRIAVRVQPSAKKNEITGVDNGRLRIRLTARAVDDKANKALAAFVAELLAMRPGRVRLASGRTSREKSLIVTAESEPCWEALGPRDTPR